MSKLYRIDVRVFATAYIKADSAKEARQIAQDELKDKVLALDSELVSEEQYDSEDLSDVSLSPAATVGAPIGRASQVEE